MTFAGPGHWRIDDPAAGRAEVEIAAELGAVAEGGEGPADCLGFGLLEVIPEALGVFTAPARGGTTTRNLDLGPEDSFIVTCDTSSVSIDGIRMLAAEPDEAPLDLKIFLAADEREMSGWDRTLLAVDIVRNLSKNVCSY